MQLAAIQEYMEYLFCVALKKCGNLNDAEDLTQEVLLAALQYPKEIVHIKPWLCMVLNHKYYDMLRKKYKLPTVSMDLVPEEAEVWKVQESDEGFNWGRLLKIKNQPWSKIILGVCPHII